MIGLTANRGGLVDPTTVMTELDLLGPAVVAVGVVTPLEIAMMRTTVVSAVEAIRIMTAIIHHNPDIIGQRRRRRCCDASQTDQTCDQKFLHLLSPDAFHWKRWLEIKRTKMNAI
ncbi:hypothetical protein Avi_2049 [Allorhizobium ampelinum S4]|uniref:Uncharacterized protein n=1 Tax=Allorhizobium ampelinum (strain ATCC BAA-846 / DSM 112012 / S4) TaxID=311402 RepID=B9JW33_ALLAM|nr:hypothetical protein Avi_2049 [Allorhizobium ampelinum S4]